MLLLFYQDTTWKDWNPILVKNALKSMDKRGQLIEDRKDGTLHGFCGFLRCTDDQIPKEAELRVLPESNGGGNVVPLFVASDGMKTSLRMRRKLGRKVGKGTLWSWRKGHLRRVLCHQQ
jgi:hypothetical protein